MAENAKSRVSYAKELKDDAKKKGIGYATVSITFPNGTRAEYQYTVSATEARFLNWAAILAHSEESRPIPDLEALVLQKLGQVLPA